MHPSKSMAPTDPSPRRGGLPLLAGLALLAGPALGQPVEESYAEVISVLEVVIPVEVRRDGRPVRGLTIDDFEVLDNGQTQEIVGFEVVDLTLEESRGAPRPAVEPMPAAPAAAPSRGRHFLLLFDLAFLEFSDQFRMSRALDGARRMIDEQLHPFDRVAVAQYTDGSGVQVIAGFSDDRERATTGVEFVHAVIDRNRRRADRLLADLELSGDGEGDPAASQLLMRQLGSAATVALTLTRDAMSLASLASYDDLVEAGTRGAGGSDGLVTGLGDTTEPALEPAVTRVGNFSRALGETATLLRGVPEPKHLVYFSRGFPNEWIENPQTQGRVLNRLQLGIKSVRAAGWRVQAVDIDGVPDGLAVTGRDATAAEAPPYGGYGRFDPWPGGVGFEAQSLFQLSHDTGGELFENYNDLGQATADLIERSAVTYVLAIQPTGLRQDGRYHDLEVRLRGGVKGARLRHRPGYHAPKPEDERTALERGLEEAERILGETAVSELEAAAMAFAPPPASGTGVLPLLVEVDGPSLLARAAGDTAGLEIEAWALDASDSISGTLSKRVELDLASVRPALAAGPLRIVGSIELPPGEHRIRLRVRHAESGDELLTTLGVAVPDGAGEPLVLPPMLLHGPDSRLLTVREGGESGGVPAVFSFEGQPLRPALDARLAAGEERRVLLVLYPPRGSRPAVSHRILAGDGSAVEGAELVWLQRSGGETDGSLRLVGSLRPGRLEPGEYTLEVTLSDAGSERASTASSRFRVVP